MVDVGGIYDESKQRFDHHQRGFTEVFGHGFVTKLSSAGLVYKYAHHTHLPVCLTDELCRHFGQEIVANIIQATAEDPRVELLWLKMYRVSLNFYTARSMLFITLW